MAATETNIDWAFIKREEGIRSLAYIPGGKEGKSGVTIAAGLDLAKHSMKELRSWGISGALLSKLEPFVGVPGPDARDQLVHPEYLALGTAFNQLRSLNNPHLRKSPSTPPNPFAVRRNAEGNFQAIKGTGRLELSEPETQELVRATKENQLKPFIAAFDKQSAKHGQPHFRNLPPDIQTAVASLVFQYGHIWSKKPGDRRRDLWDAAVRGDWGNYMEIIFERFTESEFAGRRMREIFLINRARGLIKECPLGPMGVLAFNEFGTKMPGAWSGGGGSASSGASSSPATPRASPGPSLRLA